MAETPAHAWIREKNVRSCPGAAVFNNETKEPLHEIILQTVQQPTELIR